MNNQKQFKAGHVALVGKPNVGKSTLLNALLGEKLAITTAKPQTTRNQIIGILNKPNTQYAFLDIPGITKNKQGSKLNKTIMKEAIFSLKQADVLLILIDVSKKLDHQDQHILDIADNNPEDAIILLNKVDQVKNKEELLPIMSEIGERFPNCPLIPISALKAQGVEEILKVVAKKLPEQEPMFAEDQLTTRSTKFFVAELIRERIFKEIYKEIPYQTTVVIEQMQETCQKTMIKAKIIVPRTSHRRIILGKQGSMLKKIGSLARKEIENFLQAKVYLDILVSVDEGWMNSDQKIKELVLNEY